MRGSGLLAFAALVASGAGLGSALTPVHGPVVPTALPASVPPLRGSAPQTALIPGEATAPVATGSVAPLRWSAPATTSFRGRPPVPVPAGVLVSTDGATYFYATTDPGVRDAGRIQACVARSPPPMEAAMVDTRFCQWAAHPAMSCSVTFLCECVMGTPGPRPLGWQGKEDCAS